MSFNFNGEPESLASQERQPRSKRSSREVTRDVAASVNVLTNNDKFHRIDVAMDIKDIHKGQFRVRDTRESDPTVNEFARMFIQGNYARGDNVIRIAILDLPVELNKELEEWARNAPKYVYKGDSLAGPNLSVLLRGESELSRKLKGRKVVYVDGMHRGAALQQEDVREVVPWPRVCLHIRKDYQPTTHLDVVVAGSQYNQESSATVKMTVVDKINSLVSVLCAMEEFAHKDEKIPGFEGWDTAEKRKEGLSNKEQRLQDLTKSLIEGTLVDSNVLLVYCKRNGWGFGVGDRQISRYCKVACRIYFYKSEIKNLIELAHRLDLPLYIITLPSVWNTDDVSEQKFILQAFRKLLNAVKTAGSSKRNPRAERHSRKRSCKNSRSTVRLNNENEVKVATSVIKNLWRSVTSFIQAHKIPAYQVPSWKVSITAGSGQTHSLSSHLLHVLGSTKLENLIAYASEDEFSEEWIESVCTYIKNNSDLPCPTDSESDSDHDDEPEENDTQQLAVSNASGAGQPIEVRKVSNESRTTVDVSNDGMGARNKDSSALDTGDNAASFSKVGESQSSPHGSEIEKTPTDDSEEIDGEGLDEAEASAALHRKLLEDDAANKNEDQDNYTDEEETANNPQFPRGFRHNAETHSRAIVKMPSGSISVNEEADSNGFCVVKRSPILRRDGEFIYATYNFPSMRTGGFLKTFCQRQNVAHDDDEGAIHMGEFIELGTQIHMTVTQYNDRDDGSGLVRADFKMSGNLKDDSPEWLYSRQMEGTIEDSAHYEKHDHQLILRAMGLRPPHRSFLSLPKIGLHNVRRALFGALVHVFQRELDSSENHEIFLNIIDHVKLQMVLHFKGLRTKLDHAGFVVIPHLYRKVNADVRNENSVWNHSETGESSWKKHNDFVEIVHNLFTHMESLLPTHQQVVNNATTEEQDRSWACIRNTAYAGESLIANHSRLMSRRPAVTRDFEWPYRGELSESLVCGKANLELSVMQIATWLRLEFSAFNEHNSLENKKERNIELCCLDTGGRFLSLIGEDAARQIGHLDEFAPDNVQVNSENGSLLMPSYFVLITGKQGSPLWVAQGSHCYVSLSKKQQTAIAKAKPLTLIRIPPWSLFIGRSDCVHAGAGGKDASGLQCLRFHMYLHRANMVIADAINSEVMQHYKYDPRCENIGPQDNVCYM